jgi:hypothetical protein
VISDIVSSIAISGVGFEARIVIGGVAQAMADMSGPDAPVRTVVDPRKL